MPHGLTARAAKGLRRRLGAWTGREPGRVNHISLGSHCHMAQVLKRERLRTWSGPFDWIFSTPGMVRDCLSDDFAALLDRSQYESVPLDERLGPDITRCRHRLYRERHAVPFVFNHHDPATVEEDYAFLEAGVRRLRKALADRQALNHFYLLTTVTIPTAVVAELCDVLAQHSERNRLSVLETEPGGAESSSRLVGDARHARMRHYKVSTRSTSLGLQFGDPDDNALVSEIVRHESAASLRDDEAEQDPSLR